MSGIENKYPRESGTVGYSSLDLITGEGVHSATERLVLSPGLIVADYEIGAPLAQTYTSEVSRATNMETGEPVAFKLPRTPEGAAIVRHEVDVHRCIGRLPFIVMMDGYGTWQERPFITTRIQERGTLSRAISEAQGGLAVLSGVVELLRKELTAEEVEAIDEPVLVEAVADLLAEGLPHELAETIQSGGEEVHVNDLLDVVASAAHEVGHDISPESATAKGVALRLLEHEVSHEGGPDQEQVRDRIRVLGDCAIGTAALHQVDFIHRDIKPANIGIDRTGAGKLIDLGIAGHSVGTEPSDHIWGSLGENISPEGYRGYAAPHSDVWALGATAFRALTGQPAFERPDREAPIEYYKKTLEGPHYTARERNPIIPSDVDRVVMAALSRRPSDRPSIAEMQDVFIRAA